MSMDARQRNSHEWLYNRGVELLQKGDRLRAFSMFEMAFEIKPTPECRSFLGMLTATERGLVKQGMDLCQTSISDEPANPLHYLNLSKLLYAVERKGEAVDVVLKAREVGDSPELDLWLRKVGVRKRPVFPFLARSNPLNRFFGLMLKRIGLRK